MNRYPLTWPEDMDNRAEFQPITVLLESFLKRDDKGRLPPKQTIDEKFSCDIIGKLKPYFEKHVVDELARRKMTLFLILQADLKISTNLDRIMVLGFLMSKMINCSQIVHILWGLGLQKHYYEIILYGPSALGEELTHLVVAANLNVKDCIIAAGDLALILFNKMRQLERLVVAEEQNFTKNILNKYFAHFTVLLRSIVIPESALESLSDEENTINQIRLQCILQLTRLCFSEPEKVVPPSVYNQICFQYDYSKWKKDSEISLSLFKHKIVEDCAVCIKNADISTSLWCHWVEVASKVPGKSFQTFIGEEMYNCILVLEKSCSSEATELISILKTMAIKPKTEDDEIEEADLPTILKNVCDKTKTHTKWLAALLKVNCDEPCFEECLSLIEKSVPIEFELINAVFDFVVGCLKAPNGSVHEERLKLLIFKSLRTYSLQEQIEAVKCYLEMHGVTSLLKTAEFTQAFTEVFNKAVSVNESMSENQLFTGLISLCCQSPEDLLMKMLGEGISSGNQTILMLKAFKIFQPICLLPCCGKNVDEKNSHLLIQTLVKFASQMELRDQEEANFVELVTSLVTESIIDRQKLLILCIFPTMHHSMLTQQWNVAILCLKIIEAIVKDLELNRLITLALMLGQVIHKCRCNLLNFASDKSVVCDEACKIIKVLVLRLRDAKDLFPKQIIGFLENQMAILEEINKSYFYKLWPKDQNFKGTVSVECLIMTGMQSGRIPEDMLTNSKDSLTGDVIIHVLVKILPKMSSREWKNISCLKQLLTTSEDDDEVLDLFNLLAETLIVINCIVKSQFAKNQPALSCINYCIRNFALFVQDKVVTRPLSEGDDTIGGSANNLQVTFLKAVFKKMLLLLESLPDTIKEPCSIFVMALLKHLVKDLLLLEKAGKNGCLEESIVEICSLISLSSIRDVRVALVRDVAEAC